MGRYKLIASYEQALDCCLVDNSFLVMICDCHVIRLLFLAACVYVQRLTLYLSISSSQRFMKS